MNEETLYQVNKYYDFQNDEFWGDIANYAEDGYVGITTGTVYANGSDYTDWCVFVGTLEECEKYCTENGLD